MREACVLIKDSDLYLFPESTRIQNKCCLCPSWNLIGFTEMNLNKIHSAVLICCDAKDGEQFYSNILDGEFLKLFQLPFL